MAKTYLFLVLILVAFVGLMKTAYKLDNPTPRFQVGDCTVYVADANEFEPRRRIGQMEFIIGVGKKEYHIREGRFTSTRSIKFYDEQHEKVDCETQKPWDE